MAAEGLPVGLGCRVLHVSESGYYAQRSRPPSSRALRHAYLIEIIRGVHLDSRGTYAARRVHAELTLGHGLVVGRCAVEMLMRRAGITEHPTREGKIFCAVVLDVFSRRVVGWSIDATAAALVTNALGRAIEQRGPDGTVIHSDQGTQFTSWAFTRRALDSGLMPSMGSVGDCFDNAVIESFWSRMQVELLDRRRWRTRVELANAIFEYLEIFHNRQRRHSALGMLTPVEFETRHQRATVA